jgi:cytochrome c oxidase subunit III
VSSVSTSHGATDDAASLLAVGTIVWLSSELMFFSGLFAAYFTLRAAAAVWPPKGVNLDETTALIGTLVLIGSSATMQLGVRAIERDDRRGFLGWLGVTFVLGSGFVALQAWDWTRLNFSVASNAYGSAFYLTTGFHGLHVIGGLLAMIVIAGRASSPRFGVRDAPSVEMLSYYWHFVDIVWIALYATIFLLK